MASSSSTSDTVLNYFFFCCCCFCLALSKAQSVPAVYVLGDSLVDVGNNNYLFTFLKANLPYNGIDSPGGNPTGRFSNGKNAADFIGWLGIEIAGVGRTEENCGSVTAQFPSKDIKELIEAYDVSINITSYFYKEYSGTEKVGLPTSPPYLSNKSDVFLKGVNFGSGGAGILNTTNPKFPFNSIPLAQQVDYFATVQQKLMSQLGAMAAQQHLAKSLFPVVIGSNDLFNYFYDSGNNKTEENKVSPQQYVGQMVSTLQPLLKKLHDLGARKLVVVGIGPLGCAPAGRHDSSTENCNDEINSMTEKYNQQLTSMLEELQSELTDIKYSYFDSYASLTDIIQNPATYGFSEVKAACCGAGKLNADSYCTPRAVCCPNRTDHVFWDKVHPTQATDQILVDQIFSASPPRALPINLNQLISL